MKIRHLLIPEPKSKFLVVRCPNCGNEQVVFSHATFPVRCIICGTQLVTPTGGKAKLNGQIVRIFY
jgi:small subunit ribosomal protein S27e